MFEIVPMTAAFERLLNNNTLTVRKSQFRVSVFEVEFPFLLGRRLFVTFDCCILITVYNGMSIVKMFQRLP